MEQQAVALVRVKVWRNCLPWLFVCLFILYFGIFVFSTVALLYFEGDGGGAGCPGWDEDEGGVCHRAFGQAVYS